MRTYIDETGFDASYHREYGYAPRGEEVPGEVYGKKFARCNLVAARIGNHLIAPMCYDGTTDSVVFEFWFEKKLMPLLSPGHVVIMDNAFFHREEKLREIAECFQVKVLFLPPYSPELNPIEKTWANIKRWLRKNLRNYSCFDDALSAFDREYGYAPRGEKVFGEISGRKFQRTSIAAAKLGSGIVAPLQYDTTMNAQLFEAWFEQQLLPALPADAVIVMDNASFHRKSKLYEIAEANHVRVVFLPPYSPDLNPIEKVWAVMKRWLRKNMRNFSDFDQAVHAAIDYIS